MRPSPVIIQKPGAALPWLLLLVMGVLALLGGRVAFTRLKGLEDTLSQSQRARQQQALQLAQAEQAARDLDARLRASEDEKDKLKQLKDESVARCDELSRELEDKAALLGRLQSAPPGKAPGRHTR